MTSEENRPTPVDTRKLTGIALLAGALILAVGVVLYFALSGGDDGNAAGGTTGFTPPENLPGAPTPAQGTGVLDPNRPEEGEVAPNFALPDARQPDQVRQLKDYRGKVVVLNFWATWCGPCKRELPEFEKASEALGDRLVVLAVNYRESPETASEFLAEQNATFPALIDGGGKVAEHYRVPGLPVTYFLDTEGVVRHIQVGEVTPEDLERYLTEAGLPYTRTD